MSQNSLTMSKRNSSKSKESRVSDLKTSKTVKSNHSLAKNERPQNHKMNSIKSLSSQVSSGMVLPKSQFTQQANRLYIKTQTTSNNSHSNNSPSSSSNTINIDPHTTKCTNNNNSTNHSSQPTSQCSSKCNSNFQRNKTPNSTPYLNSQQAST